MKNTLIDIFQRRMDRCQNEQLWAVAAYAGACAFVISENGTFVAGIGRATVLWSLGIAGTVTFAFVVERKYEYYGYRNDMARVMTDVAEAPEYMKKQKSAYCWNGLLWFWVFVIAIYLPFAATLACFTEKTPNPGP